MKKLMLILGTIVVLLSVVMISCGGEKAEEEKILVSKPTPILTSAATPSLLPTQTPALGEEVLKAKLELLWIYELEATEAEIFPVSLALSSDGSFLAIIDQDKIKFFDRSGNLLWSYAEKDKDYNPGSLVISLDGSYIGVRSCLPSGIYGTYVNEYQPNDYLELWDDYFHSFTKNGVNITGEWEIKNKTLTLYKYARRTEPVARFTIEPDRLINEEGQVWTQVEKYQQTCQFEVFNSSGKIIWSVPVGDYREIFFSADGSLTVLSDYDRMRVLETSTGRILWAREQIGAESLSADGSYIAAARERTVYLFNRSGKLLWSYTPEMVYSDSEHVSASVSIDGSYIGVGTDDRRFYLLDHSGNLIWQKSTSAVSSTPILSAEGSTIIVETPTNDFVYDRSGNLLWSTTKDGIVQVTSDGSFLVVAGHNTISLFTRFGLPLWTIDGITIWDLSFNGAYLAVIEREFREQPPFYKILFYSTGVQPGNQ